MNEIALGKRIAYLQWVILGWSPTGRARNAWELAACDRLAKEPPA